MTFLLETFEVYFNATSFHLHEMTFYNWIVDICSCRPVNCQLFNRCSLQLLFTVLWDFLLCFLSAEGSLYSFSQWTHLLFSPRWTDLICLSLLFLTISRMKTFFAMESNMYFVQMFWLRMAPQTRLRFERCFTHFALFSFFHMHALYVKFQVVILCEWFVT